MLERDICKNKNKNKNLIEEKEITRKKMQSQVHKLHN